MRGGQRARMVALRQGEGPAGIPLRKRVGFCRPHEMSGPDMDNARIPMEY